MTTDDLIQFYVNLLIIQYANQPRASGTIYAFIGELIQGQIVSQVGDAFNFALSPIGPTLSSAVGAQLEAVASYRGAQRVYYGLAPNSFFQLPDAGDTIPVAGFNGFMDATDPDTQEDVTWLFATAQDTEQPLYSLTDDQLYRLTQMRALFQSRPATLQTIDAILETFFGNNVALIDNETMTIYYVDLNTDTDPFFGIASLSNSFPHPAGVLVQTFKADMLTNFFGLQDALTGYDSTFSGFSDALTALTTGTFISAP